MKMKPQGSTFVDLTEDTPPTLSRTAIPGPVQHGSNAPGALITISDDEAEPVATPAAGVSSCVTISDDEEAAETSRAAVTPATSAVPDRKPVIQASCAFPGAQDSFSSAATSLVSSTMHGMLPGYNAAPSMAGHLPGGQGSCMIPGYTQQGFPAVLPEAVPVGTVHTVAVPAGTVPQGNPYMPGYSNAYTPAYPGPPQYPNIPYSNNTYTPGQQSGYTFTPGQASSNSYPPGPYPANTSYTGQEQHTAGLVPAPGYGYSTYPTPAPAPSYTPAPVPTYGNRVSVQGGNAGYSTRDLVNGVGSLGNHTTAVASASYHGNNVSNTRVFAKTASVPQRVVTAPPPGVVLRRDKENVSPKVTASQGSAGASFRAACQAAGLDMGKIEHSLNSLIRGGLGNHGNNVQPVLLGEGYVKPPLEGSTSVSSIRPAPGSVAMVMGDMKEEGPPPAKRSRRDDASSPSDTGTSGAGSSTSGAGVEPHSLPISPGKCTSQTPGSSPCGSNVDYTDSAAVYSPTVSAGRASPQGQNGNASISSVCRNLKTDSEMCDISAPRTLSPDLVQDPDLKSAPGGDKKNQDSGAPNGENADQASSIQEEEGGFPGLCISEPWTDSQGWDITLSPGDTPPSPGHILQPDQIKQEPEDSWESGLKILSVQTVSESDMLAPGGEAPGRAFLPQEGDPGSSSAPITLDSVEPKIVSCVSLDDTLVSVEDEAGTVGVQNGTAGAPEGSEHQEEPGEIMWLDEEIRSSDGRVTGVQESGTQAECGEVVWLDEETLSADELRDGGAEEEEEEEEYESDSDESVDEEICQQLSVGDILLPVVCEEESRHVSLNLQTSSTTYVSLLTDQRVSYRTVCTTQPVTSAFTGDTDTDYASVLNGLVPGISPRDPEDEADRTCLVELSGMKDKLHGDHNYPVLPDLLDWSVPAQPYKFYCSPCQAGFYTREELVIHRKSHSLVTEGESRTITTDSPEEQHNMAPTSPTVTQTESEEITNKSDQADTDVCKEEIGDTAQIQVSVTDTYGPVTNKSDQDVVGGCKEKSSCSVVTQADKTDVGSVEPKAAIDDCMEEQSNTDTERSGVSQADHTDVINIDPQADVINIDPQADVTNKGPQADVTNKGPQADVINKGPQADVINIDPQTDVTNKGPQADVINKGPQADVINIDPQADVINIDPHADVTNKDLQADVNEDRGTGTASVQIAGVFNADLEMTANNTSTSVNPLPEGASNPDDQQGDSKDKLATEPPSSDHDVTKSHDDTGVKSPEPLPAPLDTDATETDNNNEDLEKNAEVETKDEEEKMEVDEASTTDDNNPTGDVTCSNLTASESSSSVGDTDVSKDKDTVTFPSVCDTCGRCFRLRIFYERHLREHESVSMETLEEKEYACAMCSTFYSSPHDLWAHNRGYHSDETLPLEEYGMPALPGLPDMETREGHEEKGDTPGGRGFRRSPRAPVPRPPEPAPPQDPGPPPPPPEPPVPRYMCVTCREEFCYREELVLHQREPCPPSSGQGEEERHACPPSSGQGEEERHACPPSSGQGKEERHACTDCGRFYTTAAQLARHQYDHEPISRKSEKNKKFRCSRCETFYDEYKLFSNHMRQCHNLALGSADDVTADGRAVMEVDNDVTGLQDPPAVTRVTSPEPEGPHRCGACGMGFQDERKLERHVRHHDPMDKDTGTRKPHTCQWCQLHYTNQKTFLIHQQKCRRRKQKVKVYRLPKVPNMAVVSVPETPEVTESCPTPEVSGVTSAPEVSEMLPARKPETSESSHSPETIDTRGHGQTQEPEIKTEQNISVPEVLPQNESADLRCDRCPVVSSNQVEFNYHKIEHQAYDMQTGIAKRYKCLKCRTYYSDWSPYYLHVQQYHPKHAGKRKKATPAQ